MRIQFLSALVAVSAIGAAAAPAAEYNNKGSLSTINGARSLVARRFTPEAFNRRLADFKRDDDDDDDDDDDEDEDEDSDSSSALFPLARLPTDHP